MQRDEVFRTLSEHRTPLNHAGVRTLACFGSVAHDEAGRTATSTFWSNSQGAQLRRSMELRFLFETFWGDDQIS